MNRFDLRKLQSFLTKLKDGHLLKTSPFHKNSDSLSWLWWRDSISRFSELNSVDRRQICGDGLPGVSAIFADPDRTGCRPENEAVAGLIHIESVAINQIIGVFLRQTAAQRRKCFSSVFGSIDDDAAVDRASLLVFL